MFRAALSWNNGDVLPEKTLEMPLTKIPLAQKHDFFTKNHDSRVWGMSMSHHSMGPIPCQEAYLAPEAQKYYSSLGILLATQTHFFWDKILLYFVLVSLS